MGMDVFGKRPVLEAGRYFDSKVYWWHPLADYIEKYGPPDVVKNCGRWHSNDGDGLDRDDAIRLADALQTLIDVGHTAEYESSVAAHNAALYEGTGPGRHTEFVHYEAAYVQKFARFLRSSGGFEIW